MNSLLARIALLSCLVCPTLAAATWNTPTSAIQSDSDSFSFVLAAKSSVSIGFTWSDMLVERTAYWLVFPVSQTRSYTDGLLSWALSGTTSTSGVLTDPANQPSGKGTLTLGDLNAGSYKLTLTGSWQTPMDPASSGLSWTSSDVLRNGDVNLLDGDRLNCSSEANTFRAIAVTTPVPEPGTYAMLIAGLGLMGCIARRRSRGAGA